MLKNMLSGLFACAAILPAVAYTANLAASPGMVVESFSGPVTAKEMVSFKSYIQPLVPATDNIGNQWAQGASGEQTKAMGLVYEINGDRTVLDKMLVFCDSVLSERNDLAPAPVGQHKIWTGRIDPVWPNDLSTTPIGTGGEQGDPVGHLGYCARLILATPSIWHLKVGSGDPKNYGADYYSRAKKYVTEADYSLDRHIFKSLLNLTRGNLYYFSAASPYKSGLPVPWNQQMMFNYALQNLAACHEILGDDPARATKYNAIVSASIASFFATGVTSYKSKKGNDVYDWGYTLPDRSGEDNNHGSLDIAGFYRAYATGRYGITSLEMTKFANTFVDVVTRGPKDYAGRINGSDGAGNSAPTTMVRGGYLFLAEFLPQQYNNMMGADFTIGKATGRIDQFSRFLWVKNQRNSNARKIADN
ncbi:hypothetical protein LT85_2483 [Collimonas arenae]|uniref:Uncharacterized protein n=1 Tax=Collimonas arenae TaxID=279058 RepID=A0A0A1FAT1_9BURK|nr:hypothetical protein [Collimonas arenae]AIY41641.1 hypothetical protein LT85_2483 [Collimonas arenae]